MYAGVYQCTDGSEHIDCPERTHTSLRSLEWKADPAQNQAIDLFTGSSASPTVVAV